MKSLLEKIVQLNKFNPEWRSTESYNIFSVLQIQSKEVLTCRVIADLLNPKGQHGFGDAFLRRFLDEVLEINPNQLGEIENAVVTPEYVIDADRRIDIVIEVGNRFIPIEVKIYAEEQKSQCYDYLHFARRKDPAAKVYYLTRTGYKPSEYSMSGTNGSISINDLKCISFKEHIRKWLMSCRTIAFGDVRLIIEQFLVSISKMSGYTDEKVVKMVSNEIVKSEDYFRAAIQVSDSINEAKANVIYKLLKEFESQMEPLEVKFNLTREENFNWYEYRDKANDSFYSGYSTYPGLNYVVNGVKLNDGYQLWLRIEIEHALFAGFCVFDPNANDGTGAQVDIYDEATKTALKSFLKITDSEQSNWWASWWYLPTGERQISDNVPNFKAMNEIAITLADDAKRRDFVAKSVNQIASIITRIMEK